MTGAEELQGYELRIPLEERAPVPEGEYFHSDLIGCSVVEQDGTAVGTVTGWKISAAAAAGSKGRDVKGEKELMILSPADLREIDVAGKRIVVQLPEGLKEL